ncbi:MAG: shikimate dehydrogenase [bacterium]
MTDCYAVIGNPIAHSKSPEIHAAFAKSLGHDISYERILGNPDDFAGDVQRFFDAGGMGMNVTVPFKEQAFELAEKLSDRARIAQAVNTLMPTEDGLFGDNTDGAGLVTDLGCNHLFQFHGARILLLGAGGAARGVVLPLLEQSPATLVIANRTASKAETLATELNDQRAIGTGFDGLAGQQFDLIVNATAAGLKGEVPPIPDDVLANGGWTYDMMYASEPTAFMRWGQQQGAGKALDGIGMLVEQAAEAYFVWRGARPVTDTVINQLKGQGS